MTVEAHIVFACFGSTCSVHVGADGGARAVARARRRLVSWHDRFTRFSPESELSRLNADTRPEVPTSPIMRRFATAVVDAARLTGGLVDATLLAQIESAGYTSDRGPSTLLRDALALAPPRHPAQPRPAARWPSLGVDDRSGVVRRPPGLLLDSGGLAKGLFADVVAETLSGRTFAIDCAGDVRVGGHARRVDVQCPFDGRTLHHVMLADAGVATSGIGRRSWLDSRGEPAHHLIDPATGRAAFTGVVQATAIAPTALEAEVRAKAALLSGPERAAEWLPDGGVIVLDDGNHLTI